MSAICHCVEWGNEESGFMPGYIIVFGPSMHLNGAMQEYAQRKSSSILKLAKFGRAYSNHLYTLISRLSYQSAQAVGIVIHPNGALSVARVLQAMSVMTTHIQNSCLTTYC